MSLVSLNTAGRPVTPVDRVRKALDGFTVGQRAMVVLAVVVLAAGGFLFSSWASKPSMAPLFSGMAATDASSVVDKLKAQGIPYQLADSGQTVLVPQDKVYDLRLSMASAGLPSGGQEGYALLDKQGITTSDFQQHVGYQRALEGELAKTIQSIDGVTSAQVHLVVPRDDVFATDSVKPSAAVLVATSSGTTLDSGQVQAVVHLVSSSVSGMTADEVTVADSAGHVLSAPGQEASAAGDMRAEQTKSYEDRIGASLQSMLDNVLGAGHAVVRVTADLNLDSTKTTTESAVVGAAPNPVSQSTSKETYSGSGAGAAAGVLGADSNGTGTTTATGATTPNSYSKETSTVTNAVGQQTVETTSTPGTVKRMAVAVVLDAKSAAGSDQATVEQLVRTASGFNQARGDTVTVSTLPFSASASAAGATAAKAAKKPTDILGLATTAALVLGLLIVGFATWRGAKGEKRTPVLLPGERAELVAARSALAAVEARAIDAQHSLPAGTVPAQRPPMDDQIGNLVDSQPDEVAQLLRGWLAETQ